MARKVFNDGDILFADDVNVIGNPIVDGQDELGRGPKVLDDYLSDESDQIKNRFYNFYDRLKVTENVGLTVNYNGGNVLLGNGSRVTLTPGTLNLTDNSTLFIYVNNSGNVEVANSLANESFPMAYVVTSSGNITTLEDLRDKLIDRVTAAGIPPVDVIPAGSGMEYYGSTLPNGWLWADGSFYDPLNYPALFSAIGYTHGQSGSLFAVPDKRGRTGIGAGQGAGLSNRTLGQVLGEERVTLSISEMPSHSHGLNQTPHSHGITQTPHSHGVNDPGHNHRLYSWSSGSSDDRTDALNRANTSVAGEVEPGRSYLDVNGSGTKLIETATTGISLQSSSLNISLNTANANISVNNNGGGASHNNIQPSLVCNYIIKF
ncbi:tail fiber protein [Picosynechococcus sp. PCC 7117]|uniref:tail fiber protein n=1 Tax=Picosynechococcus sp. PCC 7117 TaxID=195498 RepID=UPI0008109AF7|nr:tail fiber protein [Picosynechococcus sp. PCC 7117]ANV88511.1 hypothetical protein AWQ22_14145 [Picosynechococcus sp. PCC 7117]